MLQPWFDRIAAALPARCDVCRAWPAQPVCHDCMQRFHQIVARCRRCAIEVPEGVDSCGACLLAPPELDACHAAVRYAYPWTDLIGRFKFRGEAGWGASLAALMRRCPQIEAALAGSEVVVPMPLSRRRLAERGFNQALELARRLAPARVDARSLLRVRDTAPQVSLDRRSRTANVAGAFAVEPSRAGRLHGRKVLLVDDVMTSGASLQSAAQALRQAGAAEIAAVVLARAELG